MARVLIRNQRAPFRPGPWSPLSASRQSGNPGSRPGDRNRRRLAVPSRIRGTGRQRRPRRMPPRLWQSARLLALAPRGPSPPAPDAASDRAACSRSVPPGRPCHGHRRIGQFIERFVHVRIERLALAAIGLTPCRSSTVSSSFSVISTPLVSACRAGSAACACGSTLASARCRLSATDSRSRAKASDRVLAGLLPVARGARFARSPSPPAPADTRSSGVPPPPLRQRAVPPPTPLQPAPRP